MKKFNFMFTIIIYTIIDIIIIFYVYNTIFIKGEFICVSYMSFPFTISGARTTSRETLLYNTTFLYFVNCY